MSWLWYVTHTNLKNEKERQQVNRQNDNFEAENGETHKIWKSERDGEMRRSESDRWLDLQSQSDEMRHKAMDSW